jgi:hypothetical protein
MDKSQYTSSRDNREIRSRKDQRDGEKATQMNWWDFSARFGARSFVLPLFYQLICILRTICHLTLSVPINSQSGICPYHKITILVLQVFSCESSESLSLVSVCLILARSHLACSRLGFASSWEHTNGIFQKVIFSILIRHILSHSWYALFMPLLVYFICDIRIDFERPCLRVTIVKIWVIDNGKNRKKPRQGSER